MDVDDLKIGRQRWVISYNRVESGHIVALDGGWLVLKIKGEFHTYEITRTFPDRAIALLDLCRLERKRATEALQEITEASAKFEEHINASNDAAREAYSLLKK